MDGWGVPGDGENAAGWDEVYPLGSSSDSEDDEVEHDPGTLGYRMAQATGAFAGDRAQSSAHSQPVAPITAPPMPPPAAPLLPQQTQPPIPQAAPASSSHSASRWSNYVEETWGTSAPQPPPLPPPMPTTTFAAPERYQRTEGRHYALAMALSGEAPTAGQMSQLLANPLLPERKILETPNNLLMDTRRFTQMARRIPSPARVLRQQLRERRERELEEELATRLRRLRGPTARMGTGAKINRPRPKTPPHPDSAEWVQDVPAEDILAAIPVSAEPPSSTEAMDVSVEPEKQSDVSKRTTWRTLHRAQPSAAKSAPKKTSRPYDPAELNLVSLKDLRSQDVHQHVEETQIVEDMAELPPAVEDTIPTKAKSSSEDEWEEEEPKDFVDQFAHMKLRDRKVRVHDNQGKLGKSACGWKAGRDDEKIKAWGDVSSSCACQCKPESVKDPKFKEMLTQDELRKVRAHEMRCLAVHRTSRNALVKCNRKLKLQGEEAEFYWWPQSGTVGVFCPKHLALLREHKICPFCREFFEEDNKDFMVCHGEKGTDTHLYHLDCRAVVKVARMCPHCLASKEYGTETGYEPNHGPEQLITIQDHREVFGNLQKTLVKIPAMRDAKAEDYYVYCTDSERHLFESSLKCTVAADAERLMQSKTDEEFKEAILSLEWWALLEARKDRKKWGECFGVLDESSGRTLVHRAVVEKSVIKILLLSQCGSDIHRKDASGETPLMLAVKTGAVTCVYALLIVGADVNTVDKDLYTPLHWAAIKKSYALMSFFLDFKANASMKDNYSMAAPLFHTLLWIREACFLSLINRKLDLELQDANGWTILHWVAFFHRNDLAKYFFETVTPWMRDNWGETPLHVAIRVCNTQFVRIFVSRRPAIVVSKKSFAGLTPYKLARVLLGQERDKEKIKKFRIIIRLMERFIDDESLETECVPKLFGDKPIGEACGDLTSGRALAPIPVYNFLTKKFDVHELLYVTATIPPLLYQTLPRKPEFWQDACKFKEPYDTCVDAKCRCAMSNSACETICRCVAAKEKKIEGQYCGLHYCTAYSKHAYNVFIDQCYVPKGQLDSGTTALSRNRPPFSDSHRESLKKRLLAKMQRCNAVVGNDLLHILALVEASGNGGNACGERRFRRSHSMETFRNRTIVRKRSESVGRLPVTSRSSRKRGVHQVDSEMADTRRYPMRKTRNLNHVTGAVHKDEDDQYRKFVRNPFDLFDEIQQCEVDGVLESAVIRFERRHEFIRWDLSSRYPAAPARHPLDKPAVNKKSRYTKNLKKLKSYEEFHSDDVLDETPVAVTLRDKAKSSLLSSGDEDMTLSECSIRCDCGMECPMRALQWPTLAVRLALIYVDSAVGWGLLTLTGVLAGQCLGEYTGELALGNLYCNDTYMYQMLDDRMPSTEDKPSGSQDNGAAQNRWSIDAKRAGSITRYANHSCNPNSKTATVYGHGVDIPRLCLIALRDIPAGDYIT
ncbi:uncharacterized protein LOC129597048 isoform X2 [Paramacrobiotus metropolitanus]|nr:uncharacterized protein LOC129597048 isoform X2 [Paramacrobiotus metropolitanus]